MGILVNRTERIFTDDEIARIAGTYHAWRGTPSARAADWGYADVPGFCYSATTKEIREQSHVLAPGSYVGAAEVDDGDGESVTDKIEHLTKELLAHFDESARLEQIVRTQLEHFDV